MSSPFQKEPQVKEDIQTVLGAIVLGGAVLVLFGLAMLFIGIWSDWRWAVSGLVPLLVGIGLLRFAWRLS